FCNDRSYCVFDPMLPVDLVVTDVIVGVKVDGEWQVYDPGSLFLPAGKLNWFNENVPAVIADKEEAKFLQTVNSPSSFSRVMRNAELELDALGDLTREVKLTYNRHHATRMKRALYALTPTEQEDYIKD